MSGTVGPVAAALIGAGGAIAGGVSIGVSNFAVESVRHRRIRADERAREELEVRRAARLVYAELDQNLVTLSVANSAGEEWPLHPNDVLRLDVWKAQRAVLAARMTFEAWSEIWDAYRYADLIRILGIQALTTDSETPKKAFESGLDALEDYR